VPSRGTGSRERVASGSLSTKEREQLLTQHMFQNPSLHCLERQNHAQRKHPAQASESSKQCCQSPASG
jgi:hypothetical protein